MNKPIKSKPPVSKCIVEVTEPISLQCPNGDDITYGRPTLTVMNQFIDQELYRKRVRVLASNLPAEALNPEWQAHRKSCGDDINLAIDSFCALFGVDRYGQSITTELKKKLAIGKKALMSELKEGQADG